MVIGTEKQLMLSVCSAKACEQRQRVSVRIKVIRCVVLMISTQLCTNTT